MHVHIHRHTAAIAYPAARIAISARASTTDHVVHSGVSQSSLGIGGSSSLVSRLVVNVLVTPVQELVGLKGLGRQGLHTNVLLEYFSPLRLCTPWT